MSLLAVDPGTEESGWVIWRDDNTLWRFGISPNEDVLDMCARWKGQLAIEMIASYGMAVGREVFETVLWVGRFLQVYPDPDLVRLVYRREVKKHLCGNNSAKDSEIMHAIKDLFPRSGGGADPVKGTKAQPGPLFGISKHCWAALGVALTVRGIEPGQLT
jgi:hypothetical protein